MEDLCKRADEMSIKSSIWFDYLWRRLLGFVLIYIVGINRFYTKEEPLSFYQPSVLFLVWIAFECLRIALKKNSNSPIYNKTHPLKKIKKASKHIDTIMGCSFIILVLFIVGNIMFSNLLHSLQKVVTEQTHIDEIPMTSSQLTDYHSVKTLKVSDKFYVDWAQNVFQHNKSKENYLDVTLYGLALLSKHKPRKDVQYYLVNEHSKTFEGKTVKLPRPQLNPVIEELSLRAFNDLAKKPHLSNVCLEVVPDWKQSSYFTIIKKALPTYLKGPHYFFYRTKYSHCQEGLSIAALVMLCVCLLLEVLLLPIIVTARLELLKEQQKYAEQTKNDQ